MQRLVLLILFVACSVVEAQQAAQESVISIRDRSPSGGPLLVIGDVTVRDRPAERLRYSVEGRISLTNASSKPILITVVSLQGENTPRVNETTLHDYYFSEPFEPNSKEDREWNFGPFVSQVEVKSGGDSKWIDIEPERSAEKKVFASVLFVQYSDGSTWGDASTAKAALDSRRNTVKRLADLESVYRNEGEEIFINDLSKPTDLPAILLLQDFYKRTSDKSKVVDRFLRLREASDDHARMIKSTHGKP